MDPVTQNDTGVLLISHGTVDNLDDLPVFLRNIRRGHAAPPELLAEVRRRYEAIGGKSPLNEITQAIAVALEERLGFPVRMANRLFKPYAGDVLANFARNGITKVLTIPMAQHSAKIYGAAVQTAALELTAHGDQKLEVSCAPNWGKEPLLVQAYADAIRAAIHAVPESERAKTTVVLSAHSLPTSVIAAGDPYETEFRESADLIARAVGPSMTHHVVCFQSQGMSTPGGPPVTWLGPGLEATLDAIKERGDTRVIVAPVGFLADHVEILYDIDVEAKAWAASRNLTLTRTASLNSSPLLLDTLEKLARALVVESRAVASRR